MEKVLLMSKNLPMMKNRSQSGKIGHNYFLEKTITFYYRYLEFMAFLLIELLGSLLIEIVVWCLLFDMEFP